MQAVKYLLFCTHRYPVIVLMIGYWLSGEQEKYLMGFSEVVAQRQQTTTSGIGRRYFAVVLLAPVVKKVGFRYCQSAPENNFARALRCFPAD